jgi:hypothetical protein
MTHRPRTSNYEWTMAAASDIGATVTAQAIMMGMWPYRSVVATWRLAMVPRLALPE